MKDRLLIGTVFFFPEKVPHSGDFFYYCLVITHFTVVTAGRSSGFLRNAVPAVVRQTLTEIA